MELMPCPWKPAPADCWEAGMTSVKAVMRRKLTDHYELKDGTYLFKGGFSTMKVIEDGAVSKAEHEGDAFELELGGGLAGLAYGVSIIAVVAAILF